MSLRGDPRSLSRLAKSLPTVAIGQRVAARVAPALTSLALASFDARQTPYGEAWAPGSEGGDVDLVETGALRSKVFFVAVGRRVRAVLGVKYAKFQIGTRGILPRAAQTLPPDWRTVIADICQDEIRRAMPRAA